MSYQAYLKSDHWRSFRASIYSKRSKCQNCGQKKNLNIHHRNYKCLGKETNNDVIVLCNRCHSNFHSKKKWIKKMYSGEDLAFTNAKDSNLPFYNKSDVLRVCRRCNNKHSVFYREFKSGQLCLAMMCPNSKPRTEFIPFEKLDISIVRKRENKSHT